MEGRRPIATSSVGALRLSLALLAVAAACAAGCADGNSPSADRAPAAGGTQVDVSRLNTGPELYQALCAACHGATGAADGPGAQSLYPPARNLRTHRFRLVSTENQVPTRDDIDLVIARGMPGTSMRAFSELSSEQRELLVDEVLRFRREGEEELIRKFIRSLGASEDDAEIAIRVHERMTPAVVVEVSKHTSGGREAIQRGRTLYFRQGCQACHGSDGVGVWDVRLVTDEGIPTRGRDLVHEPFKGGHSRESIYLRIALGMPGSPMPASRTLSPQGLSDLTDYCLSLSREPKRLLTNHQRAQQATARAYLEANK